MVCVERSCVGTACNSCKYRRIHFKKTVIIFQYSFYLFDNHRALPKQIGHIGIYGFTKKSLHDFCALGEAPLEDIEKLEQLRALYHGKKISMVKVASAGFGIDTVEDLERAKKIFGL